MYNEIGKIPQAGPNEPIFQPLWMTNTTCRISLGFMACQFTVFKGIIHVESPRLIPSSVFYSNFSAFSMNCSREIQHRALKLAQMANMNKLKLVLLLRISLHLDCLTKTSCNPLQMTSFVTVPSSP